MACPPNAWYLETGLLSDDSPLSLEDGTVALPLDPDFSGNNVAPIGMIDDSRRVLGDNLTP